MSKIEQWGGAVRLMLAQLLTTLTNRPDKYSFEGRNQDPVLLIFDEAARWGKLEVLPEALTTLRSRCVTTLMAIQSIASLDRTYGTPTRRVILDCCSYTVIAAVHDAETQKYCSELVGGYHTWSPSMSETYHPSRWEIDVSRQLSAHREPILYPEEFATLREFVLVSPYGTYFVEKDPYYETEPLLFEQRQDGFRRLLPANKYEEDYFYDDPRTHR